MRGATSRSSIASPTAGSTACPALAADLVALKPDILFVSGTQATLAVSKATGTIPIVFVAVTDPDGLGIVKSLRQSGTNATGLSNQSHEFQLKLLQLVKDAFPAASDVAVLYNPLNVTEPRTLSTAEASGRDTRAECKGDRG